MYPKGDSISGIDSKIDKADRALQAFMTEKTTREAANKLAAEQVKKFVAARAKLRRRYGIYAFMAALLCIVFETVYHMTGNFSFRLLALFEGFLFFFFLDGYRENRKW